MKPLKQVTDDRTVYLTCEVCGRRHGYSMDPDDYYTNLNFGGSGVFRLDHCWECKTRGCYGYVKMREMYVPVARTDGTGQRVVVE